MKRCWIWFLRLSRFGQIGVCVVVFHFAAIALLLVNHATSKENKTRKAIAIRTHSMPRPAILAEAPSSRTSAKAQKADTGPKIAARKEAAIAPKPALVQEKKSGTTAGKQDIIKNIPSKKGQEAVETKKKEEVREIDTALLQEIAESLGAIAASTKVSQQENFSVSLPNAVEIRGGGVVLDESTPAYGEVVAAVLQKSLNLPEYGEVVVKIGIDANGRVIDCEILDTRSRKNAEFLKKRLQELAFPCFNEFGLVEKHINFTITFHNVENL